MMSRKLALAAFVLIVSAIGLFTGYLDAGSWVAASSISLSIYGASNIAHARWGRRAPEEPLVPIENEEGEA